MPANIRTESDSFGPIDVPADRLWGAQTERARHHFGAAVEPMPIALIHAIARVKRAAARTNRDLGVLEPRVAEAIVTGATEILDSRHDGEFPLPVWQSGSGTQTHMNVNEVLANRGCELLGGQRGDHRLVHPNDHVNRGQSSNDVVPTAMHLCAIEALGTLLPAVDTLREAFQSKAESFADVVKVGRTHLQDAVPMTLGQEFSGYASQLATTGRLLEQARDPLLELAIGGTAVGTGLNAHPEFGARVAALLAEETGVPLVSGRNKFALIASHDGLVHAHGAMRTLACALVKIGNDLRWLASGPRCGLGELRLPELEPGSSIMPGKVNPTQIESLVMAATQVLGNDVTMGIAGAGGQLELSTYKPLLIATFLQSARLLTEGCERFRVHVVTGVEPDRARLAELIHRSLMLATALTPHIGYDRAAEIVHEAHASGRALREVAIERGVDPASFDRWTDVRALATPGSGGTAPL
ncbi:MAG: class II fumarate hydratase [Acidobacteria bacterium]|nr:class II fumarate hydratase [Acidobacteriota bacterium]